MKRKSYDDANMWKRKVITGAIRTQGEFLIRKYMRLARNYRSTRNKTVIFTIMKRGIWRSIKQRYYENKT